MTAGVVGDEEGGPRPMTNAEEMVMVVSDSSSGSPASCHCARQARRDPTTLPVAPAARLPAALARAFAAAGLIDGAQLVDQELRM